VTRGVHGDRSRFGDSFSYDVSADGQRILVNTDLRESDSTTLTLLLNWTGGAKK
jgi:hypothetical protein